jgi:hypothetical protein
MATTTTRLGLRKPAGSEFVSVTTDLDNNFDTLDAAVSTTYAATSTRPSTPFQGQAVYESDSGLLVVSNGSAPASGSWLYPTSKSRVVTSGTRPSTVVAGMEIRETDTHNLLYHNGSTPTSGGWEHQSIPAVSTTSAIVAPYTNQLIYNTTDNIIYKYTGSAWIEAAALGPNVFSTTSGATLHEASYTSTANQTITTGTDTPLAFATSDYTCNDVTRGTSTAGSVANAKFTLGKAGLWLIEGGVRTAGTTSAKSYGIWFGPDGGTTRYRNSFANNGGTDAMEFNICCVRRFASGTALCLNFWHNQGSNHTVTPLLGSNSLRLVWMRP